jgi:hypothetical protein
MTNPAMVKMMLDSALGKLDKAKRIDLVQLPGYRFQGNLRIERAGHTPLILVFHETATGTSIQVIHEGQEATGEAPPS